MKRRPDWEARLAGYLAARARMPHIYGRNDCMLFVAGAVKAMTGRDFGRGHRGRYDSAATAARYLHSLGHSSPVGMIDALLPPREINFAQRGDVVVDDEGIVGIVIGGEAVFVGLKDGETGLVRLPREKWRKAWAV